MFSLLPRCARRGAVVTQLARRSLATPAPASKGKSKDEDDEGEGEGEGTSTFKAFLRNHQSLRVAKPLNYIEESPPFPLNESFKPPPPISDNTRTQIWNDYMADPERNNVRALSRAYHLSLKRVEAILRLKGLEAAFIKGKPLQTGFQWGMEMILGVNNEGIDRVDMHTADMLEQEENRDSARQRFQRQYWESIPDDGKEPLLPASLEHAKRVAERSAQAAQDRKSSPRLMPRLKDTDVFKSPRQKVQTVERPGRLPIHFVDVGGKFLDVEERLRRISAAGRRQAMTKRQSEEKVLQGVLQGRMKGRNAVQRARRAAVKEFEETVVS
ncbi:eukaryotic mitochondrial regulator protein-domain-containing protein [Roridomyces roridus]|uniref:Eukaryotic mitochondrial regulator protein-domain-containing protein n=1 Tax=Roridomyces roridus TaxID=1738132 RepID=A0AAD7F7E8_9AGAR|nr:eukaryotic mitochondrial regulator protein-domain-containing protein [Roridomyces roridus]